MDMCHWNIFKILVAHVIAYATWVKISLGGTFGNHLAKITRKLDPISKIKFHLLIHYFI
jgi:hypothetical protein